MKKENILDFVYKAIDEALANVHTICICRVESVGENTINVKPVIARQVGDQAVPLPVFQNVPPVFMRGGGSYTAHPIAEGDFALLLVTERCFDAWYGGQGNAAPPAVYRMHDYSDGVALVGISPLSGAIPIPSNVRRVGDSEVTGNYEHEGDYVLTGNFTINGNLTVNGNGAGGAVNMSNTSINLTGGDITADTISLKTHKHTGVQAGGANTGTPTP